MELWLRTSFIRSVNLQYFVFCRRPFEGLFSLYLKVSRGPCAFLDSSDVRQGYAGWLSPTFREGLPSLGLSPDLQSL